MLNKLSKNRGGFTLVEIMIVVAIIALLAAIAVPNFLRARKRSQATRVLEDVRMIDGAKDQYAIESNLSGTVTPTFTQLQAYIKKGTPLFNGAGNDALGNSITINTIDDLPQVSSATYNNFTDVVDDAFWGSYKP